MKCGVFIPSRADWRSLLSFVRCTCNITPAEVNIRETTDDVIKSIHNISPNALKLWFVKVLITDSDVFTEA